MPYEKFYRFYDAVMGDRAAAASYIGALIDYHRPIARSVLEIACGTGTILGLLSESYEVTGLDRSRKMLAIARETAAGALLPPEYDVFQNQPAV